MATVFGIPLAALFGQLLIGLINGSFYALLSLGLAVIFGLLRVINFAHGAQYMLGAFVAYLLLQWLGSARIYSWMTANPGGYFDPFSLNDFADPLVRETYHAYHMDVVRETVARTVPTINYPGATAFHNALDENLMASLTGAKTAAQAMADTADAWAKITRRTGEEKIIEAIKANKAAWPTVLDPV